MPRGNTRKENRGSKKSPNNRRRHPAPRPPRSSEINAEAVADTEKSALDVAVLARDTAADVYVVAQGELTEAEDTLEAALAVLEAARTNNDPLAGPASDVADANEIHQAKRTAVQAADIDLANARTDLRVAKAAMVAAVMAIVE